MTTNPKKRHLIQFVLRAKSNILVTAFGDAHYDVSDPNSPSVRAGKPAAGDKADKFPLTRTTYTSIVNPLASASVSEEAQADLEAASEDSKAATAPTGKGKDGKKSKVYGLVNLPIIPSSKVRGSLHRCLKDILADILIARGDTIALGTYRGLCSGSATGQPDSIGATFDQSMTLQRNPLISLFGGGSKLVSSSITGGHLYPICQETMKLDMVPGSFFDYENPVPTYKLTQVAMRFRGDDTLGSQVEPLVLDLVTDAPKALADWANRVGKNAAGIDKSKPEKKAKGTEANGEVVATTEAVTAAAADKPEERVKAGVRNMFATETIVPGVMFYGEFTVDTNMMDHAGLGLFLLCLEMFAQRQSLGAMTTHGYGKFDFPRNHIGDADDPNAPTVPLLIQNPETLKYSLNRNAEVVTDALSAWDAFSVNLSSTELDRLYLSEEKKDKGSKPALAN